MERLPHVVRCADHGQRGRSRQPRRDTDSRSRCHCERQNARSNALYCHAVSTVRIISIIRIHAPKKPHFAVIMHKIGSSIYTLSTIAFESVFAVYTSRYSDSMGMSSSIFCRSSSTLFSSVGAPVLVISTC